MSTQDVGEALLLLAGQFQSEGSVGAAVQCLEAIAQAKGRDTLLPLTEGRARRQLGALLLAHTHNLVEAKAHLEKSQLLVADLHGNWDLKLGVMSDLGCCNKLLGNIKMQRQMYQSGLDLCQKATKSGDCATIESWQVHFLLRLADSLVTAGETTEAMAMVEAGQANIASRLTDSRMKILCMLFMLQLHLVEWSPASVAEKILVDTSALLASLPPERHSERLTLQLKLHFHILRVMFLLRLGHNAELGKPLGDGSSWMPGPICAMEDLMTALGGAEGALWEYEWMPAATTSALVSLLSAQILQSANKVKHVLAHLHKCQALVESELAKLDVDFHPRTSGESQEMSMAHHTIWDSRLLLVLRYLSLEAQLHVYLTMTDLPTCQRVLCAAIHAMQNFPVLLQQLRPSLWHLIGMYCHSTGAFQQAAGCFLVSQSESTSSQWTNMMACHAALSFLGCGTPQGLQQAVQAIGNLSQRARDCGEGLNGESDLQSLQERALALLTSGTATGMTGAIDDAKWLLSKALRIAHGQLSNQQIVCQVLNALGSVSLQSGDAANAEHVLGSSFQISKGIHDLPAMVGALNGMKSVLLSTGNIPQAEQNHQYTARKAMEIGQIAAGAGSTQEHSFIMAYAGQVPGG